MKSVTNINLSRLLAGGVLAGVVVAAITGLANSTLLSRDFSAWASELGNHLHPPDQPIQLSLWTVRSILDGLAGVWIYASIRPGGGPRTALIAALFVWAVGRLGVALDLIALGVFPMRIVLGQSAVGMIAIVSGVWIGSWIYAPPEA